MIKENGRRVKWKYCEYQCKSQVQRMQKHFDKCTEKVLEQDTGVNSNIEEVISNNSHSRIIQLENMNIIHTKTEFSLIFSKNNG